MTGCSPAESLRLPVMALPRDATSSLARKMDHGAHECGSLECAPPHRISASSASKCPRHCPLRLLHIRRRHAQWRGGRQSLPRPNGAKQAVAAPGLARQPCALACTSRRTRAFAACVQSSSISCTAHSLLAVGSEEGRAAAAPPRLGRMGPRRPASGLTHCPTRRLLDSHLAERAPIAHLRSCSVDA